MTIRNPFPSQKIRDISGLTIDFYKDLAAGTKNQPTFITLDDIDSKYRSYNSKRHQLDDDAITYLMSNIHERQIIKDAIQEYAEKGLVLKPNVRNSITIQAEQRKFSIKRYLLTPVTKEDRERLYQIEGCYGVHPLDRYIGLSGLPFKMTVNAMLKVSKKAQEASSFRAASIDLNDDCGIKLDPCTISDVTSHIGYIVFKNDMERAELLNQSRDKAAIMFPPIKRPGVLYLQVDGAMVHLREKKEGDNSDTGWREHKLGMVYDSEHICDFKRTNKHGDIETQHKILKKEYSSYIGTVKGFKKLIFENACRNGYGGFKDTVVISDGATWIANLVSDLFPDAVHILDYYHVSEKIWDLGRLIFPDDSASCKTWCDTICNALLESRHKDIIGEIISKEKAVNNSKLAGYLEKNKTHIDYKSYTKRGYCIGSGAIEGSNKNVVQHRLKLSGMRWNRSPAQSVATLRSKKGSDRWYSDVVIPVRQKYGLPCI
jgi:hypothetical protein